MEKEITKEKKETLPQRFEKSLPLDRIDPAAVAAAESAKAMIQSVYLYAMRNPRNEDQARDDILRACKRPAFAEKVEYSKPVSGKQIKGPSIRFAELALRAWGNVITKTQVVYDDEEVRRIMIFCIDAQTNITHSKEAVINKTVERKKPTPDREVISERTNTNGDKVYVVRATEDELQNKEAAIVSKSIRNEGLRLIPTDMIDDAIDAARATLRDRDAKDPDAAKKSVLDSFSELGVRPKEIETYLGHKIDTISPKELQNLRSIYRAIKDGEASWKDYMEKGGEEEKEPEIDPDAIKKFDEWAIAGKLDITLLNIFLDETAKANEMTIDQLKAGLVKSDKIEIAKFWDRFEKYAEMAKKRGTKEKEGLFKK